MSKPGTTADNLEGFDTYDTEFVYEPGVGLTIYAHRAAPWLSWDETQKLAAWLAACVRDKP